jgi:monoterpene epsilon-lactone hydrolase
MRIAARYVRWQRGKERDRVQLEREFRGRTYPKPAPITRALKKRASIAERRVRGHTVYTFTPKQDAADWHIVYLHGGSFVNELVGPHWDMIDQLMRVTGATITVPLYPLAPEHPHAEAFAMLDELYRDLITRVPPERLVLAGDSAGGNLAIAQALRCRDAGLALPAQLILFAPWLDLTMRNPEAASVQARDPMLWIGELAVCGAWWAGGDDPASPALSPVFADLRGAPRVQIYQGTDDVLMPDARRLRDRLREAGVRVHYHETPDAFHVFMGATFLPEARAVFLQIAEQIRAP